MPPAPSFRVVGSRGIPEPSLNRLLKNGCGCRVWPFATLAAQGGLFTVKTFSSRRREQKASHTDPKRGTLRSPGPPADVRRRGAVCGVAAPPRWTNADGGPSSPPIPRGRSPSSRLLASDPAALATPPTPFFSNLLREQKGGPRGPPFDSGVLVQGQRRLVGTRQVPELLAVGPADRVRPARVVQDVLAEELCGS